MFGSWRTLLALGVVAFHLLHIPVIGEYAVFSFFVLSGFLMTTIMHESYGYELEGLRRYAFNRFLRLYPAYWVAAAISLLIIYICGADFVRSYKPEIAIPNRLSAVFSNVTLIYTGLMPEEFWPRLSPPTWALTVEITYYFAIGLGISRTQRLALIWLGASVLYVSATFALNLSHKYHYGAIPAGSFPFATGSCLYFYKTEALRLLQLLHVSFWAAVAIYLTIFVGFTTLSFLGHNGAETMGLYVTVVAAGALLIRLNYVDAPRRGFARRLDKLIVDFSYPIYLLHWQLGALASFLLFGKPALGLSTQSAMAFAVTLAFVGIVSAFMIFVMDPTIEQVRTRIRAGIPELGMRK
jgi:peptidoglycan/LPS O-acetylase OafA/YrhL